LLEGALEPPSEVFIHSSIYLQRADVGGVVHVHPLYATALSMTAARLEPLSQLALGFRNGVAYFDDPWSVASPERGVRLVESLGGSTAVLMRGHGATVVGRTVEEAAALAVVLEDAAKLQYISNGFGDVHPIDVTGAPLMYERWLEAMEDEYLPTAWTWMVSKVSK
jgi:ribulose-5-phosphate 4-epimerase/fuculose-1-phosphate aldolase